jgi:hypothetical protein
VVAVACTDPNGPASPLGLEPPAFGLQLAMAPFTVPPDTEVTQCRYVTLRTSASVYAAGFEGRMREGSHHFILYRSLAGSPGEFQGECEMELLRAVLYGGQTGENEQGLPPGVAMEIPAGATLILESHYVNHGAEPIVGEAVVNIRYVDRAEVANLADVLFFLNRDIAIPPRSTVTVEKTCELPAGAKVFVLASHMHRRGTAFRMDLVDWTTGDSLQHLYDNYQWDDPLVVKMPDAAPLEIGPDRGLRFRCTYRNDDDVTVRWGLTSEDEMCIAFGAYYPSQGIRYCF